jgi:hypothetical protein
MPPLPSDLLVRLCCLAASAPFRVWISQVSSFFQILRLKFSRISHIFPAGYMARPFLPLYLINRIITGEDNKLLISSVMHSEKKVSSFSKSMLL